MSDRDAAAGARRASEQLASAIVANDPAQIGALLGEEWRLVGADGGMPRSRFLELVDSGDLSHSMMRAVGDVDVRIYGATAVVFSRVVNTARFGGQVYDADEWTTDVFVWRDDAWLCVHSHVTAVQQPESDASA